MSIYEETKGRETTNKDTGENIIAKQSLTNWEESDRGVWVPEGVIYLFGEISEFTLFDFMTRIRTVIRERDDKYKDEDVNLIINSPGGDVGEMFGVYTKHFSNISTW